MISILLIENRKKDIPLFQRAFDYAKEHDILSDYQFVLCQKTVAHTGNDSSSEKQKESILSQINSDCSYNIILIDMFLRHDEEFDYSGDINLLNLLSIKIFKEVNLKNNTCVIFTSSKPGFTGAKFKRLKKNCNELNDKNWYFVHKPEFDDDDEPSKWDPCPKICKVHKERFDENVCNMVSCFLFNMLDIYLDRG